MRLVSCAAAVVGGILLLVRLAFDVPESVQWAGLALLGVAVLCGGLMLVPAAPLWLQAIVGPRHGRVGRRGAGHAAR